MRISICIINMHRGYKISCNLNAGSCSKGQHCDLVKVQLVSLYVVL